MVTALATRWGVTVHDNGKTVWVKLVRSTSRLDMRPYGMTFPPSWICG